MTVLCFAQVQKHRQTDTGQRAVNQDTFINDRVGPNVYLGSVASVGFLMHHPIMQSCPQVTGITQYPQAMPREMASIIAESK